MKNLQLIIVFLFSHYMCASQFSIGITSSFDRHINEYHTPQIWTMPNTITENITEYSFGVQANYQFTEKLGIRGGFLYALKGYKFVYEWVSPDGHGGITDPAVPLETTLAYYYFDIPLGLYYSLIHTEHFKISPSLGIINSIKTNEKQISKMGDDSKKNTN